MLDQFDPWMAYTAAHISIIREWVVAAALRPNSFILTCLNGFMCFAVFWACLCRLRMTSTETMLMPRFAFSVVMVVHVVSGFRGPLFGTQVSDWWPIVFTTSTWCILLVNIRAWRHGAPPELQKNSGAMPLDSVY